jgi:hypothetical protein
MANTNQPKNFFTPIIITDPLTGKEKVVSAKDQEEMLEKGILIAPIKQKKDDQKHE